MCESPIYSKDCTTFNLVQSNEHIIMKYVFL